MHDNSKNGLKSDQGLDDWQDQGGALSSEDIEMQGKVTQYQDFISTTPLDDDFGIQNWDDQGGMQPNINIATKTDLENRGENNNQQKSAQQSKQMVIDENIVHLDEQELDVVNTNLKVEENKVQPNGLIGWLKRLFKK